MKTLSNNWERIIYVAVLLATLAFGYGKLSGEVKENKASIAQVRADEQKELAALKADITEIKLNLSAVSLQQYNLNGNIQRLIGAVDNYRREVNKRDQ